MSKRHPMHATESREGLPPRFSGRFPSTGGRFSSGFAGFSMLRGSLERLHLLAKSQELGRQLGIRVPRVSVENALPRQGFIDEDLAGSAEEPLGQQNRAAPRA